MSSQAPVSTNRADANRANAQLSTGPVSEAGKAKSSLNALKTGLTGRTVLLPFEDAEAYAQHLARFEKQWSPATDAERDLVQSLADTEWRLLRIPTLELGIYALGRLEFADTFAGEDPAVRPALIDAHIFRSYRRDLSNLSLQEGRLRRQREKDTETLQQLQQTRKQKRQESFNMAVSRYIEAAREHRCQQFDPQKLGFEFSIDEIDLKARQVNPALFEYDRHLKAAKAPKAA